MTILFAGDPHRNFSPIIRTCLAQSPGTLILLGDQDCQRPLNHRIRPGHRGGLACPLDTGQSRLRNGNRLRQSRHRSSRRRPRFSGRHSRWHPRRWASRRFQIIGLVSSFRCWKGTYRTATLSRPRRIPRGATEAARWWRDGLPLWHRDTIFPDDADRLAAQRFDVLVTHEAPSSHKHGFAVIDEIARSGGARLIVHGHHHDSYTGILQNGITVRGLGLAEPWLLPSGGG